MESSDREVQVFYLIQDYLFLLDYSRVFAHGVIKAHDEATMAMFATLLNETLNTEMDLHRGYCAKFGVSATEMEAAPMAPTTHAYTRHLLDVAQVGTLADIVAGVLPCQWGYAEIGTTLAKQGGSRNRSIRSGLRCTPLLNSYRWASRYAVYSTTSPPSIAPLKKNGVKNYFLLSSRYEYLFWEMAYTEETWKIE